MVLDFDRICRLCLNKDVSMVPIFGVSGKSNLSELIESCICLKVSESDRLPPALCLECLKKLDKVKEFKDQCEQSYKLLHQFLLVKESDNGCDQEERSIKIECLEEHSPASNQQGEKKESSDTESDNFVGDEISSELVSLSIRLKQEQKLSIKLKSSELSSGKSPVPTKKVRKRISKRNKGAKPNSDDENEDSEYVWPGSLSDNELDHNAEEQTDSMKRENKARQKARSQRPYECEFCGKTFPRSNHLVQHELTHTRDKPFHCSYCNKSFWYKNSLISHIKQTHTGDVNFTCEECGRGFFQRSEFNRHIPIHSNETPFKCSECGMAFKLEKNLKRHQKVHTALRTHTCQYCGKSFRMLQTLRVHLILHTGEKPFKCSYCGRGFSQSAPLKAHTRMHTGEKPYQCNVCREAFSTGNALKAHTFKHTGIHPNSCKDCCIVFKRKRELIDHCDQVHGGVVTEPVQVAPQLPHTPLVKDELIQEEQPSQANLAHQSPQKSLPSQKLKPASQVQRPIQHHAAPPPHSATFYFS